MSRALFTASTYSHLVNFHRPYLLEFKRMGWQVDVACGTDSMEIPEANRVIHVPFEKSITSPKNLKALDVLRAAIDEGHYDLISCHTSLAAFFTRLAVVGLQRRPVVVCTSHGYLFDDDTSWRRRCLLGAAERLVAPVTDLLMTMNQWDARYARKHKLGKVMEEIPGIGVDFLRLGDLPVKDGLALREQLGFGAEHFLLVYAAEFSERKNQKMLIRTLAQLPEQVGLLLPGDGSLRNDCIRLARELGVERRISFPGQVKNMSAWYAAANAAVSASRSEGLPFNVMEAMYYSLPVVASEVKGNMDLICHGENGLLFPYGDCGACAEQVLTLMNRPEFARTLGRQAAEDCRQYDLSVVLPKVMEIYGKVIPLVERQITTTR